MAEYTGNEVELVPGTLRGYRQWGVARDAQLASISMRYQWRESTIEATCMRAVGYGMGSNFITATAPTPQGHGDVPAAKCTCGVYAKHKPFNEGYGCPVFGVIEAWGRVQVGVEGFRAAKARIVALAMPKQIRTDDYAEFMRIMGRTYKGVAYYPTAEAMWEALPPIDVSTLVPPLPAPVDEGFLWAGVTTSGGISYTTSTNSRWTAAGHCTCAACTGRWASGGIIPPPTHGGGP